MNNFTENNIGAYIDEKSFRLSYKNDSDLKDLLQEDRHPDYPAIFNINSSENVFFLRRSNNTNGIIDDVRSYVCNNVKQMTLDYSRIVSFNSLSKDDSLDFKVHYSTVLSFIYKNWCKEISLRLSNETLFDIALAIPHKITNSQISFLVSCLSSHCQSKTDFRVRVLIPEPICVAFYHFYTVWNSRVSEEQRQIAICEKDERNNYYLYIVSVKDYSFCIAESYETSKDFGALKKLVASYVNTVCDYYAFHYTANEVNELRSVHETIRLSPENVNTSVYSRGALLGLHYFKMNEELSRITMSSQLCYYATMNIQIKLTGRNPQVIQVDKGTELKSYSHEFKDISKYDEIAIVVNGKLCVKKTIPNRDFKKATIRIDFMENVFILLEGTSMHVTFSPLKGHSKHYDIRKVYKQDVDNIKLVKRKIDLYMQSFNLYPRDQLKELFRRIKTSDSTELEQIANAVTERQKSAHLLF